MRGVVSADENRVVLGRVEREGPDETGMPQQLHAIHHVASHTQAVAVVAQPRLGWERRSRRPAREVLESPGVDDPLRPESAYEADQVRGGGNKASAGPVDRRANRGPVELVGV